MNNNLALSDYIDLDDKKAKVISAIKMLVAFGVLMTIYQELPLLSGVIRGAAMNAIYLISAVLIAYIARYFGYTTKVVNKPIKLGKVTLTIYTVFTILLIAVLIINKVAVFKLKPSQISFILISAIFAGIIEEALFRGLLLNMFIDLFSKSKYVFIWAALAESICFGCAHLLNLSHQSFINTVGEICVATGMGLMLTYLRFASNGIILGMLWHIYQDFSPVLDGTNFGNSYIGGSFIYFLILTVIALPAIYSYNKRFNEGIVKE